MPITIIKGNKTIAEATGGKAKTLTDLVDLKKKGQLGAFVSNDEPEWKTNAGKIADEMGALMEQMKPLLELQDQYGKLAKSLREIADENLSPDQPFMATGDEYQVHVKEAASKREIADMEAVKKFMGEVTFMAVAKVTLTDCDTYLNEEEKKKCINFDPHGGSRSVQKPIKKS